MEQGPAIFAGVTFTLFGGGLLLWTGARTVHRLPVAHGVRSVPAVVLTALAGSLSLVLGVWCLGHL
ncbi:hypothetical protein [Streptomyces sp. NPDC006879]|uniref:hypothetical protein n=1 Tax=Streptomyces sp. NPDC006879 TaxID=3364767 RepID=UPI00367491D4